MLANNERINVKGAKPKKGERGSGGERRERDEAGLVSSEVGLLFFVLFVFFDPIIAHACRTAIGVHFDTMVDGVQHALGHHVERRVGR
jgi:hypothetical protein